jgi:hypothetical protein
LLFSFAYGRPQEKFILGMGYPQHINNVTFTGTTGPTSPSDLSPGAAGVNFTQTNASVTIPFASRITPIVTEISIPNTNTNVKQITVVITASNGTVIVTDVSPPGTNAVTNFTVTPLPENSTVTITFQTTDNQPPQNVTISIIACYTPSNATTIVTTGTTPPSIITSTPTLTMSSTTSLSTQFSGEILC